MSRWNRRAFQKVKLIFPVTCIRMPICKRRGVRPSPFLASGFQNVSGSCQLLAPLQDWLLSVHKKVTEFLLLLKTKSWKSVFWKKKARPGPYHEGHMLVITLLLHISLCPDYQQTFHVVHRRYHAAPGAD